MSSVLPDFPPPTSPASGRGEVALALGGGAARGWAHLGVLRVLAEADVRVAAVAGTSIGALAALCLAAGKLDVLEEIALGATKARVRSYLGPSFGRGALLGGRRIRRELETQFAGVRLEALAIPTALVAADLATGCEVRLRDGAAVAAVEASMALPGLFRPIEIDGRRLIDGGMVACVPIGAARDLAPGLPLVAVDLMSDYLGQIPGASCSAVGTVRSAFLMLMAQQTRTAVAADPPEVLLTLPVGHIGTGAFTRARELIAIGRAAAEAALPAIQTSAARSGARS